MISTNVIESQNYVDSLTSDISRSAVIAVHLAWLDFSSSLSVTPIYPPRLPLDFLVLYQSMVYAFSSGGHEQTNHESPVESVLSNLTDPRTLPFGRKFIFKAAELASASGIELDLEYYADLFVACINRGNVDYILSGQLSCDSKRLENPDNW